MRSALSARQLYTSAIMGKKSKSGGNGSIAKPESVSTGPVTTSGVGGNDFRLTFSVQAGASATEVVAIEADAIRIRLGAPPVDGEANQELVRFLAKTLAVSKSDVVILQGHKSKQKVVKVQSVNLVGSAESVLQRLRLLL